MGGEGGCLGAHPGLTAGIHTRACLVFPHRCLQLLILCCQTQVGRRPPTGFNPSPPPHPARGCSLLSADRQTEAGSGLSLDPNGF